MRQADGVVTPNEAIQLRESRRAAPHPQRDRRYLCRRRVQRGGLKVVS